MQSNQLNVISFNPNSVYSDIQTFLTDEHFSSSTRTEYLRDIKQFFSYMNKPNLQLLTHSDLLFEQKDIIRYRNFLINDLGNAKSTANRKIDSLQSLYAFLSINQYATKHSINTDVFKLKKLKYKPKSYGHLTFEEVEYMIQSVLSQVKGYEKSCLIKLATRTSLREDTLLNLTWNDITKNQENDCYMVHAIEEKTLQEMNQPISNTLYNELIEIKNIKYYQQYSDDKVFHLTSKTICGMIAKLREELNICPERKIVFHSFRNYAANYIIDTTGDFKASQLQLGHTNINTQWTNYVNKQRDISQSAGLLLDEIQDQDAFNKLTPDELLQLLNSTTNGIRTQLIREASKIILQRTE